MQVSLESILQSYKMLSDPDSQVRERANLHLLTVIDHPQIWKITENMITGQSISEHRLLGAQILYQKLQRDIDQLGQQEKEELKLFIFGQLTNQQLNLPTVRKLAGSASLIAASLYLDSWKTFVSDLVKFMETSPLQLRNGMVVVQRFPQELKATNRIKHGLKLQIRQDLLQHSNLLAQVFWSAIELKQTSLTELTLESLQNWVLIGFPLLSYPKMVNMLLNLANSQEDALSPCCKMFKQALRYNSQQKYQSVGDLQQVVERTTYSQQQNQSLNFITLFLQELTPAITTSLKQSAHIQKIENYSLILKELMLSYNCLLTADVGYQLVELMFKILDSEDLKLSYSTFEFWLDFVEKLSKLKVEKTIQDKFFRIVEHLFGTILQKVKIDQETLMSSTLKDDDTLDDIQKINIEQYRKEASFIVKLCFDFFSSKLEMEGSLKFFRGVIGQVEKEKQNNQMIVGLESSIWAVKAALQSMVRPYDTQNIVKFNSFVMSELNSSPASLPPRVISEVLNLFKDCNREIKQDEQLFLNCLQFSLRNVSDPNVSHYAVYAFHSLMQSVGELSNDTIVQGLIEFYSTVNFPKETILQKIIEGILTSITKLKNKQAMQHYLLRIVGGIENKYKNVEKSTDDHSVYISLIEIKTLLNSFDEFKVDDRKLFRPIFMQIAIYGLSITNTIVQKYISKRIKFTSVGDLGAALSVLRSSLRLCQNCQLTELPIQQYLSLMETVKHIFQDNLFPLYNSLTDIITRILTQFIGENVPAFHQWLTVSIPPINSFFFGEISRKGIDKVDPDTLRYFFSLQESILLYSKDHYLGQPEHMQIFQLAVSGLERVNQRSFQRKATTFLHNCLLMPQTYHSQKQQTLRSLFSSIPNINNICHITLSKTIIILLEGVDLRSKQSILRQLLDKEPYSHVAQDLKGIMAKFMAFAVDSKVQRFIKGCINDLSDLRWKDMSQDAALHLQLRFNKWKRQYKEMSKQQ